MRFRFLIPTVICAATALAACNQAERSTETARDVSAAREDAREEISEARQDASEARQDANRDTMEINTETRYDVAVARIDGEHEIAVQKCEALAGDAQADCKKSADEGRDAALEIAKTQRDGNAM